MKENKPFNFAFFLQIVTESAEYRSLLMLCFAYQRTNFIEHFFSVPLQETAFQYEELEILYGFGYMDGVSKEILEPHYKNGFETVRQWDS